MNKIIRIMIGISAIGLFCVSMFGQASSNKNVHPDQFYDCVYYDGSTNDPLYLDMSIIYKCGDDYIELHGKWMYEVYHGKKYYLELGEQKLSYIDYNNHDVYATKFDQYFFKWCRSETEKDVIVTCGMGDTNNELPKSEWNKLWYPNPMDYGISFKPTAPDTTKKEATK